MMGIVKDTSEWLEKIQKLWHRPAGLAVALLFILSAAVTIILKVYSILHDDLGLLSEPLHQRSYYVVSIIICLVTLVSS